jgi:WXXGXW repeat (2 copies)
MLVRRMYFAGSMLLLPLGASALAQTVVVSPTPVPAQSQVYVAPTAPPRVETVPPPPSEAARVMYWRPGHWMWDGASWSWSQGQYVERPAPQAVWEPGHWAQQPSGGYVWVDGRWQG